MIDTEGPTLQERASLPADPSQCPPLPAAAERSLDDGLRALAIAGLDPLPDGARDLIVDHLRLMLAWTAAINLTAIRDPVEAVTAHVMDSLAAVPVLRERASSGLLDLGSGGGYPGLPLAVAVPAARAVLVDSIAKKARFLATAVTALGLAGRVDVVAARAEQMAADRRHREQHPLVSARAVAALPELVELAFPLLQPGGWLAAWKRGDPDRECRRALPAIEALGGGSLEITPLPRPAPAGHVLIVVRKHGRSAARWPRPPAERKRRPW